MLIDKYLSRYDFHEYHSIELETSENKIYEMMLQCDFKESMLIRFLFRLRGISVDIYTIEHLSKMGFIKLGEVPGKEILYGMVTKSVLFNSCNSNISPEEFISTSDTAKLKAVINFKVNGDTHSNYVLSTETRIWCGNKMNKAKFRCYWFFVKPFSQLIRKSMLKEMKKQILKAIPSLI